MCYNSKWKEGCLNDKRYKCAKKYSLAERNQWENQRVGERKLYDFQCDCKTNLGRIF